MTAKRDKISDDFHEGPATGTCRPRGLGCDFSAKGVPVGDHRFRVFVAVGTLDNVKRSLESLAQEFTGK
jgi:hypothetical protein